MKTFFDFYRSLDSSVRRASYFIFLTYFLVLFSYPLVRSATSAFFYDVYSSADYSFASFIGVIALMIIIVINNFLQSKLGIHKLFVLTGILSILTLLGSYLGYKSGIKEMAYIIFATKESYIVLLLHTCLAFSNGLFNLEEFKRLIGPIGAVGALGGIAGGQLTSYLAENFGTEVVFYVSLVIIFLTLIAFYFTKNANIRQVEPSNSITPLQAIKGVRKYIFLIGLVVAISQLIIFLADLQFNIIFEKMITLKDERTAYLGRFYSYVNLFSLVLQFFFLPYFLMKVSLKSLFMFVPILYIILVFAGLSFGSGTLFVIASVFVLMKGTDYSIFNAAKEVMYHPLLRLQKYGAKYITDMFVYRLAKAVMAFIMAQFVVTDVFLLSQIQFVFLFIWIIAIILLFKEQQKIK